MEYSSQILWSDHCVQGRPGADFHSDLVWNKAEPVIRREFLPAIVSYSAFHEDDRRTARHKGTDGVDWVFTLTVAAYNLVGLPKLVAAT